MTTKLQAADIACRAGIDTIIAAGSRPGVIGDAIACNPVGTRFHALETPLENRKRWIFGAPPAGELVVDDGALSAILSAAVRCCQKEYAKSAVTSPVEK